jgi:hypothetical protein
MQARDALYGVPYTRYGPDGRYENIANTFVRASATPDVEKKESDNLTDVVLHYLKQHYKKNIVKWVKDADWTFDPKVSVDDLILMRPAATINQNTVSNMKQELQAGKTLAPVVLVRTDNGLEVADGNHRITAMRELGIKNTDAYIATGVRNYGPWSSEMQNDDLKKTVNVSITKSTDSVVAYKPIDPEVAKQLKVGDVLTDDNVVLFETTRPDTPFVAIVEDLPTGRLLPGEELVVKSIADNEVLLKVR